ncbi:MAG: type II toxin-antitoxin system PemK/MazF family toxin, partial [Burkholderiales bacterium]
VFRPMNAPRQGDVFWANLDPTVGREIRKRRPVLSPDEMNRSLATVLAAPVTSTMRDWPTRRALRILRDMFA